jgi:hypothetical protein
MARTDVRPWRRGRGAFITAVFSTATICGLFGATDPAGASSTPGVTASTIKVGIPYVDVAAVKAVGIDIDWGNQPHDYTAIIDYMNAHGGINGRKIVPYLLAVNPSGTAPNATACTEMTEDDGVFAVLAPLMATCYLQHNTSVIGAQEPGGTPSVAQSFTLTPPQSAYDPIQLAAFKKEGLFKGKKVAVFGGDPGDATEVKEVQSALAKLHVPVALTAVDSAPQADLAASNAQVQAIAQRFQSDGVNEVVAVGNGSDNWPQGLSAIQSTYRPSWIGTSESAISGLMGNLTIDPYLSNMTTSTSATPPAAVWSNAGTQNCVRIVKKAYPADNINAYSPTLPDSKITFTGVEQACTDLALFADIAKGAGKNLTVSSFVKSGYKLKNASIPGSDASISFGPGHAYAVGPVYIVHYNPTTKALVFSSKPVAG